MPQPSGRDCRTGLPLRPRCRGAHRQLGLRRPGLLSPATRGVRAAGRAAGRGVLAFRRIWRAASGSCPLLRTIVSSTEVRRRVAAGEEWRDLVPEPIRTLVAAAYSGPLDRRALTLRCSPASSPQTSHRRGQQDEDPITAVAGCSSRRQPVAGRRVLARARQSASQRRGPGRQRGSRHARRRLPRSGKRQP